MRVVTLNVRNPEFDDGPNAWAYRRAEFYAVLKRLAPDVLALQETVLWQVAEVGHELEMPYSYGTPREAGGTGETCAILSREPALAHGTEWLSETPDVPGTRAWEAACPRVLTWADFGRWALLNLHLDHVSEKARLNGLAQAVRRADALAKPVLMVGDLNAEPESAPLILAREAGFRDVAEGTGATFHAFGQTEVKIDYLLARGAWNSGRAWVEAGAYSDHHAVVGEVTTPSAPPPEIPSQIGHGSGVGVGRSRS